MSKELQDVEMPDGTIIEDVPKGTTQAEVQRRYDLLKKLTPTNKPIELPPDIQKETTAYRAQNPPPPETVSERVRRLAGQGIEKGREIGAAIRPYLGENPVRTGFGMVGAGIGGTASLPSWAGSPLVGVPLSAAAGAAGYTGGTHVYDLITGSMPGGAKTPGEYAATIPTDLIAGAMQEGPAEAISAGAKTVLNPFLTRGAEQVGEAAAKEGGSTAGKLLGYYLGGNIGEILGTLAGLPHGKGAGEIIGILSETQAWKRASPAARQALSYMLNHQGTEEVMSALQGEVVRRQFASGGETMTGLQPGQAGADQIKPIPPTGRLQFLQRLQQIRSSQPLWSQQEGLLPTSTDLIRRR